MTTTVQMPAQVFDPQQAQLNQVITWELAQGGRIVQTAPHQAWIARKVPQVNHVMWAVLTVFSFGFLAVGWLIAVVAQPKPAIVHLWVDPQTGRVAQVVHWGKQSSQSQFVS